LSIKLREGVEVECNKEVIELQSTEVDFPEIKFSENEFALIELSPEVLNFAICLFE
jgi:hypothetical protein